MYTFTWVSEEAKALLVFILVSSEVLLTQDVIKTTQSKCHLSALILARTLQSELKSLFMWGSQRRKRRQVTEMGDSESVTCVESPVCTHWAHQHEQGHQGWYTQAHGRPSLHHRGGERHTQQLTNQLTDKVVFREQKARREIIHNKGNLSASPNYELRQSKRWARGKRQILTVNIIY